MREWVGEGDSEMFRQMTQQGENKLISNLRGEKSFWSGLQEWVAEGGSGREICMDTPSLPSLHTPHEIFIYTTHLTLSKGPCLLTLSYSDFISYIVSQGPSLL